MLGCHSSGSVQAVQLLGIRESGAALDVAVKASSREDWEREAHRLEQQGKAEQAQAIRQNVLRTAPVPWPVWNEASFAPALERVLDPKQVSTKLRQQVLDVALWHSLDCYVVDLARVAHWQPAIELVAHAREGAVERARMQVIGQHLVPWVKKNCKDLLALCDRHGVDHRTTLDATPLMLAAKAGNVALVEALLECGADVQARDLFGHTPVMHALERAAIDADYAAGAFGDVYARVAPPSLDVETDGRLVRLYPHQGEYFVLLAMLTAIKTLGSVLTRAPPGRHDRRAGLSAGWLMRNLERFPDSVLRPERRKRTWINAVLARAEVDSSYQPARKLWLRWETGYYIPNPAMRLRVSDGDGNQTWLPVHAAMALPRVLHGNGGGETRRALEQLLPRSG